MLTRSVLFSAALNKLIANSAGVIKIFTAAITRLCFRPYYSFLSVCEQQHEGYSKKSWTDFDEIFAG